MSEPTRNVIPRTFRPTAVGGTVAVFASILASVAAADLLGNTVRLRWTLGPSYRYGPETAPSTIVLVSFPVVMTALYLGFRWGRTRLERTDDYREVAQGYELAVLATFVGVLAIQLGLIALNVIL